MYHLLCQTLVEPVLCLVAKTLPGFSTHCSCFWKISMKTLGFYCISIHNPGIRNHEACKKGVSILAWVNIYEIDIFDDSALCLAFSWGNRPFLLHRRGVPLALTSRSSSWLGRTENDQERGSKNVILRKHGQGGQNMARKNMILINSIHQDWILGDFPLLPSVALFVLPSSGAQGAEVSSPHRTSLDGLQALVDFNP